MSRLCLLGFVAALLLVTGVQSAARPLQIGHPHKNAKMGGKVRTLSHACREDTINLCGARSVYARQAVDCLEEHKEELTPLCAEWHNARMDCWRQIQSSTMCDECRKVCPAHSNVLHCVRKLGTERVNQIGLTSECTKSRFFVSILSYLTPAHRLHGGPAPTQPSRPELDD